MAFRLVVLMPLSCVVVRPWTCVVESAPTCVVVRLLSTVVLKPPKMGGATGRACVADAFCIAAEVSCPLCAALGLASSVAVSGETGAAVRLPVVDVGRHVG